MITRSFRLINSFLSAIVAAFLLELLYVGLPIQVPRSVRLMLAAIAIPLKIILYSGAFGLLADMAGGRKDYCTRRNFFENVRAYVAWYALASSGVLLLHFSDSSLITGREIALPVFQAICDGVFLWLAAYYAVRSKYPESRVAGKQPGDWPGLIAVVAVYLIYVGAVAMAFRQHVFGSFWAQLVFFFAKYLQFLLFGGLLYSFLRGVPSLRNSPDGREVIFVLPVGGEFLMKFGSLLLSGYYPAVFAVLRALTPVNYRVREFNRRIWQERYYKKGALVAVTCTTSNSPDAYRIARGFKQAGAKVVMGGTHVSFLQEEALEFCDSVVIGPAEGVWEEVVRDYENNALKRVYQGTCPADKFEQVDRALMTFPPEKVRYCLETSRGCKFACDFCVMSGWGPGLTRRSPDVVAALAGRAASMGRGLNFFDYNMYADPAHMEAVLKALVPLKVWWSGCISIDVAANDKMLRLMKESGCRALLIGYEIYDDSAVSERGGKFAMARRYLELSRKIKKMGFLIKAHFIFGFEEDEWKSLLKLWWFAFRLFPDVIGYSMLQPLPGTRIHRKFVEGKRIRDLNWRNYSICSVVYDHPQMSSQLLERVMPAYFMFLYATCSRGGVILLSVFSVIVWQLVYWISITGRP